VPRSTQDLRIRALRPLDPPRALQTEMPLAADVARTITRARREIEAVLAGRDRRLLAIVGPCSIHDPVAAREFAAGLERAAAKYADDLLVIMRVYFEKPRTVTGWKGLINDPGLNETFAINDGLRLARRLLLDISALGLPAGTEFLDTVFGQYYADVAAWGCIGARTVESQVHRELASGLSMPVGFKNRTDGDLRVAIDAMRSARHPHWFPSLTRDGVPAILGTAGNAATHLVLRGGNRTGPNFDPAAIADATRQLEQAGLPPVVMVDCSHGNSGKDPARQPVVAAAIGAQVAAGSRAIIGIMLESHLVGGRQDLVGGRARTYGQSITDACLSWPETLPVLRDLARAVQSRRRRRHRSRSASAHGA
jgi:3-deoxy-7-phosphoheptulonate synthase